MKQSESIAKLGSALSKVQGSLNGAKKDSSNPFFKSKYADLESVWNACRHPLAENELAVIQTTEIEEGKPVLVTTLCHSSGEWIKSIMPLFLARMDSHTLGSSLTYARRYALAAIVGIVQTDDDGNGGAYVGKGGTVNVYNTENMNFGPGPDIITNEQNEYLNQYFATRPKEAQKVKEFFKIKDFSSMDANALSKVMSWIQKKGQTEVAHA